MHLKNTVSLGQLAREIAAPYTGPSDIPISGLGIYPFIKPGDLVFADHPGYLHLLEKSAATVILTNQSENKTSGKYKIFVDDPYAIFATIMLRYGIPKAGDSDEARIGKNTRIHPSAVVGKNVIIGDHCTIHANVVLYDQVRIGNNVTIHANSVIGSDGFYFQRHNGQLRGLPSAGFCVIEDHVSIGANSTIDRGVVSETRIGQGTKIDNQVHIGHDTRIGRHCVLAGCSAVAGCTIVEDEVCIWGQAGLKSGIIVGKGAQILAQSAVLSSVPAGAKMLGSPAIDARSKMREVATIKQLTRIAPRLLKWFSLTGKDASQVSAI